MRTGWLCFVLFWWLSLWRHQMENFPRHRPFVRGTHRWIPFTKASDVELWFVLWSAHEPKVEQTVEMPVIWDVIALIMTSLQRWYQHAEFLYRKCIWGLKCFLINFNSLWLSDDTLRRKSLSTLVHAGSCDGLLPDGTKPLPDSMLTDHRRGPLAFIPCDVYLNIQNINPQIVFRFYTWEITVTSPMEQRFKLLCVNQINISMYIFASHWAGVN